MPRSHGTIKSNQPHPASLHTLHHGEPLLVVSTGDAENVALELIAQGVTRHLLGDALVVERSHFKLIFNVDELLGPSGRIRNVQLQ